MERPPRGILIIDLLDETPGQAVAMLRDHGVVVNHADGVVVNHADGVVVDHADGTAASLGLLPIGGRPGLVLCALSRDVPGLVSAIAQERICVPRDAGGPEGEPDAWTPTTGTPATGTNARSDVSARPQPPQGSLDTMVIRDPSMVALLRRVEHVAPSNATVLITGESGTGKELIAAHLHRCSGRQGGFVAINCAGIPDALLESELFGHEKGAFYGATSRRIGKFEAANGGTLLLDEIGEMDLRMQAKVLRAVQQREIDRVGGNGPVPIDVRIVATTNRNLQQEVRLGRFRADLLFRLNVITLKVPPLRERPADIPALADFFARKFAQANGRSNGIVAPRALALLQQHTWPGNVRELENVMHRAVLIETGPSITSVALDIDPAIGTADGGLGAAPPEPGSARVVPVDTGSLVPAGSRDGLPAGSREVLPTSSRAVLPTAGRTIEAVEKDMILDTLCQSRGNRSQAAAVLGISIRTLRNKLHEYERSGTPIPRPVVVAVS
jgi:two-component system, response regulator FlrC